MRIERPPRVVKLFRTGLSLLRVVRALGHDLYELAKLEARLALSTAAAVAGLGTAIVALVATSWVLLVLALVAWISAVWLSLPAALLAVGVLMLVVALPLGILLKRLSRRLGFPETRRRVDEVIRG